MSFNNKSYDGGPYWQPKYKDATSADATTPFDVTDAPPTGGRQKVDDIFIYSAVGQNITIQDTTATPAVLFGPFPVAAGATLALTLRNGIKTASVDKKIQVKGTAAGNVYVHCSWHEITPIPA